MATIPPSPPKGLATRILGSSPCEGLLRFGDNIADEGSHNMQNASFVKTSEVLDQLDEWLTSLGIEPKRDRWHQAAELVKRAASRVCPTSSSADYPGAILSCMHELGGGESRLRAVDMSDLIQNHLLVGSDIRKPQPHRISYLRATVRRGFWARGGIHASDFQ